MISSFDPSHGHGRNGGDSERRLPSVLSCCACSLHCREVAGRPEIPTRGRRKMLDCEVGISCHSLAPSQGGPSETCVGIWCGASGEQAEEKKSVSLSPDLQRLTFGVAARFRSWAAKSQQGGPRPRHAVPGLDLWTAASTALSENAGRLAAAGQEAAATRGGASAPRAPGLVAAWPGNGEGQGRPGRGRPHSRKQTPSPGQGAITVGVPPPPARTAPRRCGRACNDQGPFSDGELYQSPTLTRNLRVNRPPPARRACGSARTPISAGAAARRSPGSCQQVDGVRL